LQRRFAPGAFSCRLGLAALLLASSAWPAAVAAVLELGIADLEGEGWHASGLAVTVTMEEPGRLGARLRAARLELPEPLGTFEDLRGQCHEILITSLRVECRDLMLDFRHAGTDAPGLTGSFTYRRDTGAIAGTLALADPLLGTLKLEGALQDGRWHLALDASGTSIEALTAAATRLGFAAPAFTGFMTLQLEARGHAENLASARFDLSLREGTGSNAPGTAAAEGLGVAAHGALRATEAGFAFELEGTADDGEIYLEPVYASLEQYPLSFTLHGQAQRDRVVLDTLEFEQRDTVRGRGRATLSHQEETGWMAQAAQLTLLEAQLPGAYEVLLQPFLSGTPLNDLQTAGRIRGEIEVQAAQLARVELEFLDVHLDDREERLAVYGLGGVLSWPPAAEETPSPPLPIAWSGGFLYGIPIGATRLEFESSAGRWRLARPARIPLLDGALEIAALEFGDFTAGDEALHFDAALAPVSLRELARVLEWPPLSGRLSGRIPTLSYEHGVLALGGELAAEIFSGTVSIRDLRIERPLEPLARLTADVELRGLELAEVTAVLAFGLMTGRLDGYVRGLEMIGWQPVAFDARVYTPEGDRSRRRISQRAVDNIASLGGGGAGALGTGFLRFFDQFSYAAFALGCRLENDVCHMSGLDRRDPGYAILRGSGLPRIDVVGFASRVSWSALVQQLAAIMESDGPEIR
jgi:hypothetical protein